MHNLDTCGTLEIALSKSRNRDRNELDATSRWSSEQGLLVPCFPCSDWQIPATTLLPLPLTFSFFLAEKYKMGFQLVSPTSIYFQAEFGTHLVHPRFEAMCVLCSSFTFTI